MCVKSSILTTLAYFDLFGYPLTKREIWQFLDAEADSQQITSSLHELLGCAVVFRFGEFYSLQNKPSIAAKRHEANQRAIPLLKKANAVCRFLYKFPFVRGIAVSGSLSKNVASESSDIDLFIITAPNRLWLARTAMHLFKKMTFLANKQHFFCMNYYIDQQNLEIKEKNIFTATEIVTLIPFQGEMSFHEFYRVNAWTRCFLPNQFLRVSSGTQEPLSLFKRVAESLLSNPIGNRLENFFMRETARRWQLKTSNNRKNDRGILMSMATAKHYAKPDPIYFQKPLLDRYAKKVNCLTQQLSAELMQNEPFKKNENANFGSDHSKK